eukprot:RCo045148
MDQQCALPTCEQCEVTPPHRRGCTCGVPCSVPPRMSRTHTWKENPHPDSLPVPEQPTTTAPTAEEASSGALPVSPELWQRVSSACGMAKDAVRFLEAGMSLGFRLSRAAVETGFKASRAAVGLAGAAVVPSSPHPLDGTRADLEQSLRDVQALTLDSMALAHSLSKLSLSLGEGVLRGLGGKDGELLRAWGRATQKEEVAEALQAVAELYAEVLTDPLDPTLPEMLTAALALQGLQRKAREATGPVGMPVTLECTPDLGRYMRFAVGSYGPASLKALGMLPLTAGISTNEEVVTQLTGVPASDILDSCWTAALYSPAWYLAVDHTTAAVVLAFRGTGCFEDVLTDMVCEAAPCHIPCLATTTTTEPQPIVGEGSASATAARDDAKQWEEAASQGRGFAHRGFLVSAERFAVKLRPAVEAALQANPGYRLVVTGYSLGAGVAAMLALLWAPVFPGLRGLAFAQPCVLSQPLARSEERRVGERV